MLVIKGAKEEILETLKQHSKEKLIFIKSKVSIPILAEILNKTNVRRIIFSKGVYKVLPKKSLEALRQIGIRVTIKEMKKGKRSKYRQKSFDRLLIFYKRGYRPIEIAEKLKMPLRTVYYYIRKISS